MKIKKHHGHVDQFKHYCVKFKWNNGLDAEIDLKISGMQTHDHKPTHQIS